MLLFYFNQLFSKHFLFVQKYRKQVAASKLEAEKDNVVVPTTREEYCIKHKHKPTDNVELDQAFDIDDDYYYDDADDDQYSDDDDIGNDDDSGNGDSWTVSVVIPTPTHTHALFPTDTCSLQTVGVVFVFACLAWLYAIKLYFGTLVCWLYNEDTFHWALPGS